MWLNNFTHEVKHTASGLGRDCVLSLGWRVGLRFEVALSSVVLDLYKVLVRSQVEGNSKSPFIVLFPKGVVAQSGRAQVLGTWGRRFESYLPHQ